MFEEFDARTKTKVIRDAGGTARVLSHTDQYVTTDAKSPQLAAHDYLSRYGRLLGLRQEHLKNLSRSIEREPTAGDVEYRYLSEKHQFDMSTVAFYQTCFGLPVWEAGLSVTMKHNPLRVVGARSTLHPKLAMKRPHGMDIARLKALDVKTLAKYLGLDGKARRGAPLSVNSQRFMIYQHDETRLRHVTARPPKTASGILSGAPSLPLPSVYSSIRDGRHYVVSAVHFGFDFPPIRPLYWVALIEAETSSVLLLRPFIDNVTGSVFQADPVTLAGGPGSKAGNAALNRLRSSVTLPGLAPPVKGTQALRGSNVRLSNVVSPKVAVPTKPAGRDFKFNARTNNFAAVNAYYNCDRVFRLVEDLGFSVASYFPGTNFPSPVDHRGHYDKNHPKGDEINAHCAGNTEGTGIGYTCFSLADTGNLKNPIGIACDWRIVLHELLGHGILYNHIGAPRFKFAHSAGDSFASIINDPDSKSPDRGATFPWLVGIPANAIRRHDRTAADGWGWAGVIARHPFDPDNDPGGYSTEQILSSTMFRFYRSIGGDSDDVATRRFAARMACHIMLGAIQTLTPATSPPDAAHFASALMKADLADWPAEGVSGGAYHKVIRWAFEKQGLYQLAGTKRPNNDMGAPPPVDVYIEDSRKGEYRFQSNYWNCQAIWNRRRKDGGTSHEEPVAGVTNYAYVKIKNRGSKSATKVVVRAFHSRPAAGRLFPDDWQPMKTAQLAAANVPPKSSAEILVGPFEWVPSPAGRDCMLMVASAVGDPSNIHNFSPGDSVPDWRLVPHDNNIAMRSARPLSSAIGTRLVKEFSNTSFQVKNPFNKRVRIAVNAILPSFLRKRGWKIAFGNAGVATFMLESGATRDVDIRLRAGRRYSTADVAKAKHPSIEFIARADGIVVGGISYLLWDKAKRPIKVKRGSRRLARSRTPLDAKSRATAKRRRQRHARH
jgi:zinc metalloprotease ZmpB